MSPCDEVLHHRRRAAALGVDEHVGVGVLVAHPLDVVGAQGGVDVALAGPDAHLLAGLLLDERAEPHVGAEEDLGVGAVLAVDVLDHLDRVRGRDAVVGLGLHLGGRVHVHHDDRAGVLRLPRAQRVRGDRVGERAARLGVGQQDRLLRREDRRRLGHEVHAAEDDRVGAGGRRLAREPERVAHVVGDVLDLGHLVVVRQDHGVALAREIAHLRLEGGDVLEDQGCVHDALPSRDRKFVSTALTVGRNVWFQFSHSSARRRPAKES